jgi:hypothetical protein
MTTEHKEYLVSRCKRGALNPLEEANAFQRLIIEYEMSHKDVANAVGRARASVSNSLRLLDLQKGVQDLLNNARLTMGHARALLSVEDKKLQLEVSSLIVEKGLSVRETEKLVRNITENKANKKTSKSKDPDIPRVENLATKYVASDKPRTPINENEKSANKKQLLSLFSNSNFNIRIEDLCFSPRTENCLLAFNIRTLNDLVASSEDDLMRLPNFGMSCLSEIKFCLKDIGLSLNMSSQEIGFLVKRNERLDLLECVATRERIMSTPHLFEIHSKDLRFKTNVPLNIDDASYGDSLLASLQEKREYESINMFLDNFDSVINDYLKMPLEGQLTYILDFFSNTSKDPMRKKALAERLGFLGNVFTLEETGEMIGITRERIRQIEGAILRKIRVYLSNDKYQAFIPKLDASIKLITAESPIVLKDIPLRLKEAGLSELDFTFKAIQSASLIYGRNIDFEILERRGSKWVVQENEDPEKYATALKVGTSVCQSFGMVQLDSIFEYLTEKMNYDLDRKKLLSLFNNSNFVSLDEDWYFDPTIGLAHNRFLNSLKKMLYCYPLLHVYEIREGFKRVCARRKLPIAKEWFWPLPPKRIISAYFKHIDETTPLEREIREIVVETAGLPMDEFRKTFIGNETNLTWIDKYIRAKRKYSSILNRNRVRIIANQMKLARLEGSPHFKITDEEIVSSTAAIELSDLGGFGNENMEIMKVVIEEEQSKVIERSDFRKKALAKGVNLSSFEVEVTYAPWLKQFGHSIWGIRGSSPKAIDIELKRYQKRSEQRDHKKAVHGINDQGRYFIVSRVYSPNNYVISISKKYSQVFSNRYSIKDTMGRSYGDIKMASDGNVFTGLGKALTRMHADIDDIIKLEFNHVAEEVIIEILPDEYFQPE